MNIATLAAIKHNPEEPKSTSNVTAIQSTKYATKVYSADPHPRAIIKCLPISQLRNAPFYQNYKSNYSANHTNKYHYHDNQLSTTDKIRIRNLTVKLNKSIHNRTTNYLHTHQKSTNTSTSTRNYNYQFTHTHTNQTLKLIRIATNQKP
eukprot:gene2812-1797_t